MLSYNHNYRKTRTVVHSLCAVSCFTFIWFFRLSSQPVLNLHLSQDWFSSTNTNVWVVTSSVASQEYIPPSSIIISMFLQITEFCLFISTNITNVIRICMKILDTYTVSIPTSDSPQTSLLWGCSCLTCYNYEAKLSSGWTIFLIFRLKKVGFSFIIDSRIIFKLIQNNLWQYLFQSFE